MELFSDHDDFTKLATGFSRIERRHKRYMNRALAENGVTGIAYSVIITIAKRPGINQDQLAEAQGVDKSRVARMLRHLELDGYILRELHPEDRRNYMISLTAKGVELHEQIIKITKEWAALISSGIAPGDIEAMIRTMDRILQNLDS